jgi:hypothetical protein
LSENPKAAPLSLFLPDGQTQRFVLNVLKKYDIFVLDILVNKCFTSFFHTDQFIPLVETIWRHKGQNTVVFIESQRGNMWTWTGQCTDWFKSISC